MILKSNLKCLYDVGVGHHLAPGNNAVPDHIAATMLKTKDFNDKVKNGTFEIVQKADPEKVKEAEKAAAAGLSSAPVSPLADTPEKKAVAAIPDIQDVNQLRLIVDLDPRPKVKEAAQKKMEEVRAAMERDGQKDHTEQES